MKDANNSARVDELLSSLDHAFKNEVELVRGIVKGVDQGIEEEWKWNAPSFNYNEEYLVTFNLWETKRIHLVFHKPEVVHIESALLEGDYPTRRMAYFADADDIKAKRPELERVIRDLVRQSGKQ